MTVPLGVPLQLVIRVDTDAPGFRRQAEQASARGQGLVVPVILTAGGAGDAPARWSRIDVELRPAARMPVFDGYLGIDIGNATSTIAHLGRGGDASAIRAEASTPSVVRIRDYQPPVSDRHLDSADFIVGDPVASAEVADPQGGEVVRGPKRLLTSPFSRTSLQIHGREWTVDKRLPIELLIAGLLHDVHRRLLGVPRRIAITCPTTFSAGEAQELRQALLQGWRRSLGATRRVPPREVTDLPALLLDEASSAALYLFVRDFLAAEGGLTAFRYLYPRGLHMLVIDCGGASTDMALIRAAVDAAGPPRVRITVQGRAGLRDFGGDAITLAVAQVLKAKLALQLASSLAPSGGKLPPWPQRASSSALRDYLTRYAPQINRFVPTRVETARSDAQTLAAKARALTLWTIAEAMKRELGDRPGRATMPKEGLDLYELLVRFHGTSDDAFGCSAEDVVITRLEVDALIEDRLEQAVTAANGLIRCRLSGQELDLTYLIGNGSLYRSLEELLLTRLSLPFPLKRLRSPQGEDRKAAVAKGAALALALQTEVTGLTLEFDGGTMDRLPYDIGYADLTLGAVRILYPEGALYAALQPQRISVPSAKSSQVRVVTLSRRWPGDRLFTPFVSFHFAEAIAGPLQLHLDIGQGRTGQFRIEDVATGMIAEGVLADAPLVSLDASAL